ncbi:MAG: DUF1080 domain-containing protein, partial [Bacteroidota bacterium]
KDLSGWVQRNGKASYQVKNGMIVGTTVSNEPNSFLCTEKDYGDFVLELELFADSTMNSGVQFRSESKADYQNGRVHGYQAEVDPSPRAWSGGIYDEGRRLWLYTMDFNPASKKAFKNGQWNKYRIECIGNHIRTWVNDIPTAHLIDDLTPKGFIALQVHSIPKTQSPGQQIMWRNIRIKTTNLKPTYTQPIYVVNLLPNQLSDAEKNIGVNLLWDGVSTKGWRGANKTSFPEQGWQIENGVLSVLKSAENTNRGGDIVTEEKFDAFELQFDFRLTEGGNSGVKYFVTEDGKSALGLEYQILDDARHPDAKMGTDGNRTIASLYDLIPAVRNGQAVRKIGEWNRAMIRVTKDNHIEHYLNGYKVVEYQRNNQMFSALIARSKYAVLSGFGTGKEGNILLQDHGDRVDFRSIKIRKLN